MGNLPYPWRVITNRVYLICPTCTNVWFCDFFDGDTTTKPCKCERKVRALDSVRLASVH